VGGWVGGWVGGLLGRVIIRLNSVQFQVKLQTGTVLGKNNTVNSGHYVCHVARLQRPMGSARTSLRKVREPERRRSENNTFNSGHHVCHTTCLQRRMSSARLC
jgi:hypothetical protein